MKSVRAKRIPILLVFIPLVYIGLPVLILLGVIPFDAKFYALTIGGTLTYAVFRLLGFSNEELGVTLKSAGRSLLRVLPITVVLIAIAFVLFFTGNTRFNPTENWLFYIFYVLISCPVQEFLYRGALTVFGDAIKFPMWGTLILTSVLYSFVHVIYRDPLTLVFTLAMGVIWFIAYNKARSLVGVSVSHAILGVVTIAAGIID